MNTHSIDLEASSSQYLSITDASQTGLDITGDITIEAWVKFETLGIYQTIINKVSVSNNWSYDFLVMSNNTLQFNFSSSGLWNSSYYSQINSGTAFTQTGIWYHVAVVVDVSAVTAVFYINGTAISSTIAYSKSTSIYNGTSPVLIGGNGNASYYFDGLIDDVRIWNDIRTSTEIADNYNKELVGNEANLVAYWKLNNSLLDETSNNNDLTNNNSATFSTDVPFTGATNNSNFFLLF